MRNRVEGNIRYDNISFVFLGLFFIWYKIIMKTPKSKGIIFCRDKNDKRNNMYDVKSFDGELLFRYRSK